MTFEKSFIDRFYRQTEKSEACWNWTGRKNRQDYGVIGLRQKRLMAHRVSYEIHIGQGPGELCVCHRCDNPSCVNPDHFFLGTRKDNLEDMTTKGRRHKQINRKGEGNPNCKLTKEDVLRIKTALGRGALAKDLATEFSATLASINSIKQGRSWGWLR